MPFALVFAQTQTPSMSSGAYMTYMIIGLIVGVIIAGVSGWLMQQSGHSFALGFVLGFFCGIFGLIVSIAMYFTSDHRKPKTMPVPPMDMYGYGSAILPPAPMEMDYQQGLCTQCHGPLPAGSIPPAALRGPGPGALQRSASAAGSGTRDAPVREHEGMPPLPQQGAGLKPQLLQLRDRTGRHIRLVDPMNA